MSNQPKPTGEVMVAGCEITGGSSRVCEHGQKSCEIRHAKPTGEWTARTVIDMIAKDSNAEWNVADAHNAALSAQGRKVDPVAVQLLQHNDKENQQLRQQLAAEREEVQTLVDALQQISGGRYLEPDRIKEIAEAVLAKVAK